MQTKQTETLVIGVAGESAEADEPRGERRVPARGERRGRGGTRVWVRQLGAIFAGIVLLALFIYFFNAISTVLLGILAATIVACTLKPLLRFIPWPRGLAAGALGLGLIATFAALLLGLSWPLAAPIHREVKEWPQTQQRVNSFLDHWTAYFGLREQPTTQEIQAEERRRAALQGLQSPDQLTGAERAEIANTLTAERRLTVEKLFENFGNFLAGEGGQRLFSRSADVMFGVMVWLVFIFVGSIFLLSEPEDRVLGPAIRLAAPKYRPMLAEMFRDLGPRLRRWVLATMISMTIVFTASLTGYLIIGLQFALPLAMLAGLCEIVPTVGPAVACVIASLFAAATGTVGNVIGVVCVYAVVQSFEAYLILPMIMRGAVKIHPAVTLFSVVLWGKIFGVPGLMLAIPINLTLWAAANHLIIRRYRRSTLPGAPPASASAKALEHAESSA